MICKEAYVSMDFQANEQPFFANISEIQKLYIIDFYRNNLFWRPKSGAHNSVVRESIEFSFHFYLNHTQFDQPIRSWNDSERWLGLRYAL